MSTTKNSKPTTPESTGPGRPLSKVAWPKSKRFSFLQLCILNGALDKEGNQLPKETRRMCPLTLRNHLERDIYKTGEDGKIKVDENGSKVLNPRSTVQVVKGEKGKSRTESGKGRKPLVYALRATLADEKANGKASKASKASTVSVPIVDAAPDSVADPVTATADPVTA